MKIEIIRKQWAQYESLYSIEAVLKDMVLPESVLCEEIENLVPNIELASDGPVIRSIFFFSKSYLGELHLAAKNQEFDVAVKNSILNYRIIVGQHEVLRNAVAIEQATTKGEPTPEPDKITYEMGKVKLNHLSMNLVSEINYFGSKREEWFKTIIAAMPLEVLKYSI